MKRTEGKEKSLAARSRIKKGKCRFSRNAGNDSFKEETERTSAKLQESTFWGTRVPGGAHFRAEKLNLSGSRRIRDRSRNGFPGVHRDRIRHVRRIRDRSRNQANSFFRVRRIRSRNAFRIRDLRNRAGRTHSSCRTNTSRSGCFSGRNAPSAHRP